MSQPLNSEGLTLTETLHTLGLSHRAHKGPVTYARAILNAQGEVLKVARAGEAWAWLRAEGLIL